MAAWQHTETDADPTALHRHAFWRRDAINQCLAEYDEQLKYDQLERESKLIFCNEWFKKSFDQYLACHWGSGTSYHNGDERITVRTEHGNLYVGSGQQPTDQQLRGTADTSGAGRLGAADRNVQKCPKWRGIRANRRL